MQSNSHTDAQPEPQFHTKYLAIFTALGAPFEPHEVRMREQAGRQLYYITARTAMNRLDNVLGPENWHDEYVPSENSVLCRLTIRLPDGTLLTKSDAGGYAGMADSGDDDKSGYSDGFKRACVKFGIARYLYKSGVPRFVEEAFPALKVHGAAAEPYPRERAASGQNGAAPRRTAPPAAAQGQGQVTGSDGGPDHEANQPRTGRALFAWSKGMEQRYEIGLLKYLTQWGKLQEYPARMIDWDAEQVERAHREACRKLEAVSTAGRGEAYEDALAS
jgi:Rad52/22 family double-strand break repair protein